MLLYFHACSQILSKPLLWTGQIISKCLTIGYLNFIIQFCPQQCMTQAVKCQELLLVIATWDSMLKTFCPLKTEDHIKFKHKTLFNYGSTTKPESKDRIFALSDFLPFSINLHCLFHLSGCIDLCVYSFCKRSTSFRGKHWLTELPFEIKWPLDLHPVFPF